MTERYTDRVKEYCESEGIEIPAGFCRHPASRYVAIDIGSTPPKLISKTWLKQEDAVYYINNLSSGKSLRLLDFKERQVLRYLSEGKLVREKEF